MRTLIVTGASGYIGRHLVDAARASGWHVVAATRRRADHADAWIPYRLDEGPAAESFPHGSVIVHLAADTHAAAESDGEIHAAGRLIEAARLRGARLVFVSSQTARPDAPTPYGRTKWAIERRILEAGGSVIRPGLVYGGTPGGVYASLLRLSRKPWLPRIVPPPRVQPVHVEDLATALLAVAGRHDFGGEVLEVAAPERVPIDAFLLALANQRFGRAPHFVPMPAFVVPVATLALRLVGAQTLAARLKSLLALPPMNAADDVARLGISLRTLAQGTQRRRPGRRALVREARAMIRYVLGRRAGPGTLRRYVRAVEGPGDGRAVRLPALVHAWPALLRALDQRAWLRADAMLDGRFSLAVAIAEASREGAARFLPAERPTSAAIVIARLAGIGAMEAVARAASFPLRALMRSRQDGG